MALHTGTISGVNIGVGVGPLTTTSTTTVADNHLVGPPSAAAVAAAAQQQQQQQSPVVMKYTGGYLADPYAINGTATGTPTAYPADASGHHPPPPPTIQMMQGFAPGPPQRLVQTTAIIDNSSKSHLSKLANFSRLGSQSKTAHC